MSTTSVGNIENWSYQSSLSTQILNIEKTLSISNKKQEELKSEIVAKNLTIQKLKAEIKIRKTLNLYLASKAGIDLDTVFKELDNELNIYDDEKGGLKVFFHSHKNVEEKEEKNETNEEPDVEKEEPNEDVKEIVIPVKKEKKKVKTAFRTVKKKVEVAEENPEEYEEKIRKYEEEIKTLIEENGLDVSLKDINSSIEKNFKDFEKQKVVDRKTLTSIKERRGKLLATLSLEEYTNLVKKQIKKLEEICACKSYDSKKTTSVVSGMLSSIDQRLIYYGKYYDSPLDADDYHLIKIAFRINTVYPRKFTPFSEHDFLKSILNYGLAFFDITDVLKRTLVNPFGYHNICYTGSKKDDADKFCFFILTGLTPTKKKWTMNNRLYDFTCRITDKIRDFCQALFRKIYLDTFHDNNYRENFRSTKIFETDGSQLLVNIIKLSKKKEFCDILRSLISEKCKIRTTLQDGFDFTSEDKLIKRSYDEHKDTEGEIVSNIKKLFDDINDADAEKILHETEYY